MRAEQASADVGVGDGGADSGGGFALDVQGLRTHLFTRWGVTRAVDGVSFAIREGCRSILRAAPTQMRRRISNA